MARLSGVITDSGSSLPLPTTKNSGDWRMIRHLERKTTRNMAMSVSKEHSGVLMTCLQSSERPGPSTVAALSADTPDD